MSWFNSIFLLLVAQLSCSQSSVYSLNKIGQIKFPLSKNTGFFASYLQYWEKGGQQYIALGYRNQLKINLYDYASSRLIKSIQFRDQGIDGVGQDIPGFHFHSMNELVVFLYFNQQLAFFDLNKDKVTKRIDLKKSREVPIVEPSVFAPIFFLNNKVYLTGNLENHYFTGKIKPLIEYDLISNTQHLRGNGLEKVVNNIYGSLYYASFDYIESKDKFIISHSISDYLEITDLKRTSRYLAKSKYIKGFPSLPKKKANQYSKDEKNKQILQPHYCAIKYDKYRKLYYRFVNKGRTLDEAYSFIRPKFSMIVLDSNFNFLTEVDIPEDLDPTIFFLNKKGLHFANRSEYNTDEDHVTFDTYLIEAK